MAYRIALALLAPLLWVQGKYVRRVTPRLPEPHGARTGTQGTGQPLRLLVLGDSAAAGVGVMQQSDALTGQLIAQLTQRHPQAALTWHLHATTGHTLAQVQHDLAQLQGQTFDVVVLSVGVNDVTALNSPTRWQQQYQHLLNQLTQQFGAAHIICSALPPMHAFPALPQPLRWVMGQRAQHFNRVLRQLTQQHPHAQYLDLALPMTTGFMASDGFHPSKQAYQVWASAIAQQMEQHTPPA
jgi:lysophospholipase L1-like esterase